MKNGFFLNIAAYYILSEVLAVFIFNRIENVCADR